MRAAAPRSMPDAACPSTRSTAFAAASSASYLRWPGRWTNRSSPPLNCFERSPFDAYARKYYCGARVARRWEPTGACGGEATRASLSSSLDAADVPTLWFIGDSVLMQAAYVAGCRLRAESGGRGWKWARPAWAPGIMPANEKAAGGVNCATSNSGRRRVCFLTAVGHHRSPSAARVLWLLVSSQLARSTDVVVVSPGAWRVENVTHQLGLVRELRALLERGLSGVPRVLYQEPLAAHFATLDGWWEPGLRQDLACAPLAHRASTSLPKAHAASVAEIGAARASASRLGIVEGAWAWSASISVDAHPGRSSASKPMDCTHYCLWSGVADAVVDALSVHLSSAWARTTGRRLQQFRVPGVAQQGQEGHQAMRLRREGAAAANDHQGGGTLRSSAAVGWCGPSSSQAGLLNVWSLG